MATVVGSLQVRLTASAEALQRELERAEGALRNFERQANRTAARLESTGLKLSAALSAPLGILGGSALRAFARWEQAEVAFTQMLGSAERARRLMEDLSRFAERTPFELSDLVALTQQLMGMGWAADEVLPSLRAIGDAVAAAGGGRDRLQRVVLALSQMRLRGRVAAQEMLQLTEAGIPAWEILAQAIGVSTAEVQDLVSRGLVPSDKAVRALLAGMESRAPGMMAAQAQTLAGRFSNLQDAIGRLLVHLGALLDEGLQLRRVLGAITDAVALMTEVLKSLPRPLRTAVALLVALGIAAGPALLASAGLLRVLGLMAAQARTLGLPLLNLAAALVTLRPALIGASIAALPLALKLLLIAAAVAAVVGAIYVVVRNLARLKRWIEENKTAAIALGAVLLLTLAPFLGMVAAALAATAAIVALGLTTWWLARNWRVVWAAIVAMGKAAAFGIAGVALLMAFAVVKGFAIVVQAISWVIPALKGFAQQVSGVAGQLRSAATDMFGRAAAAFRGIGEAAGDAGSAAGEGGEAGAEGQEDLADAIEEAGKAARDNLQSFDEVHQLQEEMGSGGLGGAAFEMPTIELPDAGIGGLDDLGTVFERISGKIEEFGGTIQRVWDEIKRKTSEVWGEVKEKVLGWWDEAKAKPGELWGAVQRAWDWIRTHTSDVWGNVKGAISGAWSDVQTNTSTAVGTVQTWIGTAWDVISRNTETAWGWVRTRVAEAWGFIEPRVQSGVSTVQTWVGTAWDFVSSKTEGAWSGLVSTVEGAVSRVPSLVATWLGRAANLAASIWNGLVETTETILSGLWEHGLKPAINAVLRGIQSAIDRANSVIDQLNRAIGAFNGLPGPDLPTIPRINVSVPLLAEGGVVTGPTMAIVGEAGPEAVLPLSRGGGFVRELADAIGEAVAAALRRAEPGEVTIEMDGRRLARALLPRLQAETLRQGASWEVT